MSEQVHPRARHTLQVIQGYDGKLPLHHYLKNYYRQHKNMGSRDRKLCSELVYAYYRLGKSIETDTDTYTRMMIAAYLCKVEQVEFLFEGHADWLSSQNSLQERLACIQKQYPSFKVDAIFPFGDEITKVIPITSFAASMLTKPRTFIRLDENQLGIVAEHLSAQAIPFQQESAICISFEPRLNLEEIIPPAIRYEVQDLSSQETGTFFGAKEGQEWLDCCAASGGKSLLLHGQATNLHITATDIRESILENYRERMKKNGIRNFTTQVWDASSNKPLAGTKKFDGIIADVPCSGSGTFGRHPEQTVFFTSKEIGAYQKTQKSIVQNVIQYLKPGGNLIYITCSVFESENEKVCEYIESELGLKNETRAYIQGYERKSDTLFIARFTKA